MTRGVSTGILDFYRQRVANAAASTQDASANSISAITTVGPGIALPRPAAALRGATVRALPNGLSGLNGMFNDR